MDRIEQLKKEIKLLNAKKYRRFNVLLKKEAFEKLEHEAKRNKKSKAKMLAEIILKN